MAFVDTSLLAAHAFSLAPFALTLVLVSYIASQFHNICRFFRVSELDVSTSKPKDYVDANEARENGEWSPVPPSAFRYPTVAVHECGGDVTQIREKRYRPFKWGYPEKVYSVNMGIKPMPWDRWYELDDRYIEYQTIRKRRLRERGSDVVCVLDDSNPLLPYGRCKQAAVEVLLDTANYLVQRYPSTFKLALVGSIQRVEVLPTREYYTLPSSLWVDNGDGLSMRSVSKEEAEQALVTLGALVQDDIAIMEEGMDGKYYFQAGLICVPGFWRMKDKIGLKLEDIHIAGNVPQYKEKLLLSLDRYFRRMRVDRPIIRHNYGGQVVNVQDPDVDDPEELAWSVTTNGMEDTYRPGHAHQPPEGLPLDVRPQALRIRSERQTLRRLPGSGCIVFGIRTYLYQVPTLCTEREGEIPESREWEGPEGKHVKDRLVSAVKSWPEEVRHYKGAKLYEDTIYNL